MLCRHCKKVKANRPRGLCWSCYYSPSVREKYPSTSKFGRRGVDEAGEHLALASRVVVHRDPVAPLGQGGYWIGVHPRNPLAGDDDVPGHELQGLPWQEALNRIRRSIRGWDAVRRVGVRPFCQEAGIVRLS